MAEINIDIAIFVRNYHCACASLKIKMIITHDSGLELKLLMMTLSYYH